MKNKILIQSLLLLSFLSFSEKAEAKKIEIKSALNNKTLVLDEGIDLHLYDANTPLKNSTVDLQSEDAWLFFDKMRPHEVVGKLTKSILIYGKEIKIGPGGNGRIALYKEGTVVMPHSDGFQPLEVFTEKGYKGEKQKFSIGNYYTNLPDKEIPAGLVHPLNMDNSIQSFRLKRGYMATLATEPDGMGYSRIFIADTADIIVSEIPQELARKVSYIRVLQWQWPSKKGWCGGDGAVNAENGKNRQENEIEITQSTWFYSWGTSDRFLLNAEFVPMKWGYGGSMDKINSRTDVTHLLGYNEPNRPDQSKMSVEQAIEEWPRLMKSGLRLGSPSVSDNSRLEDWLYKFMDECTKRNYRVDYVNVHAYWGAEQMRSPKDWYNTLREIHLRTKRPIWITEWNIGANWTKEAWPSDKNEQFAKHVRDLKQIINVLDTASFIERYSIYNWVEDKRAMIIDTYSKKTEDDREVNDKLIKQEITPAGEFYRDNHPDFAFNLQHEFIPTWHWMNAPVLTYDLSERNEIQLYWNISNKDEEMISGYSVERSMDKNNFKEIAYVKSSQNKLYFENLMSSNEAASNSVYYRVKAIDMQRKKTLVSNVVSYNYLENKNNDVTVGQLTSNANWNMHIFKNQYAETPVVLFGTPTNRNKKPLTHRARNTGKSSFEFKLDTWKYLQNPTFIHPDTIAYICFPKAGIYQFNEITAITGKANNITSQWTQINFETPFKEIPVIFASQISDNDKSTTSIRIRNVSKEGFEIQLQYEAGRCPTDADEEISYVAITPGKGRMNGKMIEIGKSTNEFVGEFFHSGNIKFDNTYKSPAFFGCMQTESDGVTSALRIKKRGSNFTDVFKEKEISEGSKRTQKESVGWIVVETDN